MDRRSFLAGLLGLAGAVAVARIVGPEEAEAAVINPAGILDELDASEPMVEEVQYRRDRRERDWRRHRRQERRWRRHYRGRRRGSRRVCRVVRHDGRWRRVCRRVRW